MTMTISVATSCRLQRRPGLARAESAAPIFIHAKRVLAVGRRRALIHKGGRGPPVEAHWAGQLGLLEKGLSREAAEEERGREGKAREQSREKARADLGHAVSHWF